MTEIITKQQRRELNRLARVHEQRRWVQRQGIKRSLKIVLPLMVGLALVAGLIIYSSNQESPAPSDIIARNGIHWHANLGITMNGAPIGIPRDIGIGVTHKFIHTHEADGVIHMEFPGLVRQDDIQLGKFFEAWGKPFNQACILETCSQPGGTIKMLVNSEPNTEFDRYLMNDKDNITISYEK